MHFFIFFYAFPAAAFRRSLLPPVCKKCRLTANWLPRAPLPFADQSESVFLHAGRSSAETPTRLRQHQGFDSADVTHRVALQQQQGVVQTWQPSYQTSSSVMFMKP